MRHLKQMWVYITRNPGLSIATIIVTTITFLIAIVFMLSVLFMQKITTYFERQPHLIVLYEPGTNEEYILSFKKSLEETDYVHNIEYIDSQQALREYQTKFEEDNLGETLDVNKFPANIRIKLKDIKNADDVYQLVRQEKETNGKISSILYLEDIVNKLKIFSNNMKIGGGVLIVLLTVISVILILITIGFNISKYGTEIEVMQLIGATPSTIILPFTLQGAFYGFMGSFLASGTILSTWLFSIYQLKQTDTYILVKTFLQDIPLPQAYDPSTTLILILWLLPIAIGTLIGLGSGYLATKRYIR